MKSPRTYPLHKWKTFFTSESPQGPDFKGQKIPPKLAINRIFWVVLAISVLAALAAQADDLIGQASVIDGDTIEVRGSRIRLWGIDAPESTQLCRSDDSDLYQCGRAAAAALAGLLWAIRRPVQCTPIDRDQYGRTVATCQLGEPGPDIGQWLVANGHALDWPLYSKGRYADAQRAAEKGERGIWSGSFVEPWQYRACLKAGGRPTACSDNASDHK